MNLRLYYIFLILILLSCHGSKKIANKNLAYIYFNDPTIIHPEYLIYHRNDSISELHFRVNSKEALYSKKQSDSLYSSELSIHYKLYKLGEDKQLEDSATKQLVDYKPKTEQRYLKGKVQFKAKQGYDYYLEISFYDRIRDQVVQNYYQVYKSDRFNRQNYLILDKENNASFENYFKPNEIVRVKYNSTISSKKIYGRFYSRYFPLPAPPFSSNQSETFEYSADSIFLLTQNMDSTFEIQLKSEGFYHLQTDTSTRKGITLFQFEGSFPYVRKTEDMLGPLRFLTTKQEFNNLKQKKDMKKAVDRFWFTIAGSVERGRAVIKSYYNRTQDANRFFTSYVEGWKTDRGLIYTIYGPPNVIYKTLDSENWIYGEQNNVLSVNFTFYKIDNPFTDNDYYLARSPVYKNSWYRSVDSWRQGRVY